MSVRGDRHDRDRNHAHDHGPLASMWAAALAALTLMVPALVLVVGGNNNGRAAFDSTAYHERFIRALADERRPQVGICFGHQLAALALGGRVDRAEVGWGVGVRHFDLVADAPWIDADATGFDLPADAAADSHDLLPWLTGLVAEPPRTTIVHNTNAKQYAIRHGDWVLVDGETGAMEPKKRSPPAAWVAKHGYPPDDDQPVELYDLKQDIGQRKNRAAERPDKVAELQGLLQRARGSQRTAPPVTTVHPGSGAP